MKIYDVIILGAGASGLMCAGNLSPKKSVLVIDANSSVAKKLKISGGGKCNITNASVSSQNFDGDSEFVSYALKRFSRDKLLKLLERNRVALELRKNRYYFCIESSQEIIELLKHQCKTTEFALGEKILKVAKEDEYFEVNTEKRSYRASNVVVATGGKSFEGLGASDIGLQIAKDFALQVKEFSPALVGLTLQKEQSWMKELSGLSCYVHIKIADKLIEEEMLFTHKGISGPAVLSASLFWKRGEISIDFLPNSEIQKLIQGSKKLVSSVMNLPKRLAKALLKAVDVEDKECNKLSKDDIKNLRLLHNYSFAPAGNFGFNKAEVSRGGVLTKMLKKETLEVNSIKKLYFIGEVVDITGELGGYNFQWAFSSAFICAKAIK